MVVLAARPLSGKPYKGPWLSGVQWAGALGNGHPGAEQRLNHTPLLVERPDRTGLLLHTERHPVMFLEHLESFVSKGWNPSDANLPK